MQKAARHSIPRGFRPTYTPCLDKECQDLLKQYEESGDPDIADHLIESLDAARRHRWEELIKWAPRTPLMPYDSRKTQSEKLRI